MKVTGNIVKAKIATFHNIEEKKVVMNALYWTILVENHAALVWYGIKGDKYDLPYAAIAVDDEVYVNEACEIMDSTCIAGSGDVWVRLSDGESCNGDKLQVILDTLKAQLDADRLEVLKVVTELNKNDKMCWLDQCELARKHGMIPYDDHTADHIFHNAHFVVFYDSKERVYHHQKISV